MPETVPNQRVARIHREMPQKGDKNFLCIKNQSIIDANKILRNHRRGASALFLWLYLAGNKDGFDLAISPKAVEQATGLPQSTCRDSIKDLVETGFLVPVHEGSNVYNFYENPSLAPKVETEKAATESAPKFIF